MVKNQKRGKQGGVVRIRILVNGKSRGGSGGESREGEDSSRVGKWGSNLQTANKKRGSRKRWGENQKIREENKNEKARFLSDSAVSSVV